MIVFSHDKKTTARLSVPAIHGLRRAVYGEQPGRIFSDIPRIGGSGQ